MNNIQLIESKNIESFLYSLWLTDEFKNLHVSNPIFQHIVQQLKKHSLFFYEPSNPHQKYHLTSIFNFIPKREYENPYINDLYYFHELLHCSHYQIHVNPQLHFNDWKLKLSHNELFSSLFSEAFIYLLEPKLIGKTFDNLWIQSLYDFSNYKQEHIIQLPIQDTGDAVYLNNLLDSSCFFNFTNNYHQHKFFNIAVKRRLYLRNINENSNLFKTLIPSEQKIVQYNLQHQVWLEKFKTSYKNLENTVYLFLNKKISNQEFFNIVLESASKDNFGRAFFC